MESIFCSICRLFTSSREIFQTTTASSYKKKNGEFLLSFKRFNIEFVNSVITSEYIAEICVQKRLPEGTPINGVQIILKGIRYILEILYLKTISFP